MRSLKITTVLLIGIIIFGVKDFKVVINKPHTQKQELSTLKTITKSIVNKKDDTKNIVFSDLNFKKALIAHTDPVIDINNDGEISIEEAEMIKDIDVHGKNISDLSGIEYFTNLNRLWCQNNKLTVLDLSKNTALTFLYCYINRITTLDLSKNITLNYLDCSINRINKLNLSKNVNLAYLICDENQLVDIDISKNTKLLELKCGGNQFTTLNLHKNIALTQLHCRNAQLTTLDLSKNIALTKLYCDNNQLTNLDTSNNTALTWLWCYHNELTTLDLSKNIDLSYLFCFGNQLTSLNIKNRNTVDFMNVNISKNPSLTCIQVDDPTATYLKEWKKDDIASYSSDCTP
ncbi:hypothetical protein ATO12_03745 [Aquimarina atlantica]|uniref:Uncharacterized protein n=1 Tax=Aquimarina atlantica TaxID=1317122 RepID=A0A023C0S7_9FLAO|nr:hypothetical protein [Aquimarina atlantica]EZH75916.1 hypothetical protein ATO12_03745 [Aquimarina atlantica]